jgi:hypothetical protein
MRHIALIALLALLPFAPVCTFAQDAGDAIITGETQAKTSLANVPDAQTQRSVVHLQTQHLKYCARRIQC